jgi:hypothetical protein
MTEHRIVCRAKVSDECYDGKPTSVQFEDDEPMSADGTFDGRSIVCDACYTMLIPLTPSGSALNEELPEAIELLQTSLRYLREHEDPEKLAREAAAAAADASPGTPYHRSATTMKQLAEAEVKRRADADAQ